MKWKIIIVAVLVTIGVGVYHLYHAYQHHRTIAPSDHRTIALYHCPMHPSYTSDKPGQCPICGMDLVPVEEEERGVESGEQGAESGEQAAVTQPSDRANVTISLDRQQLIGVKTESIKKEEAVLKIRTAATAAFNPDLAVAQREYLESKKIGEAGLIEAAKERLIILGMNEEEIKKLKDVQKGLYLQTNDSWIYPVIYEYELPYVKVGQEVMITLTGGPILKGIVRSVDSVIDPMTRTARLHVEVKHEKENINPYAFGTANIKINLGEKLLIPKSAIITTGERNIAFMVHDGINFMPMDVKLGAELEDDYVIENGLNEGDTVVTSANFLVDSESKLKAAIGKSAGGGNGGEHRH